MRHIITLIISLLWVLNSYSQEFGTHWISYPIPNDSSEVWFRKSYHILQSPIQAFINISSTGCYKLYINERNVTGSLKFEGMQGNTLLNRTLDVTRYLQRGENIIAVWYAPQGKHSHGKQLSMELYGWNRDSTFFHYQTDGSWLCTQLKNCSNGNHESFDGRTNTQDWKSYEYMPYGWLHPTGSMIVADSCDLTTLDPKNDKEYIEEYEDHKGFKNIEEYRVFKNENSLYKVLDPVCTFTDSLGYNIDFGRPFHGTIRLTLREAHKGDKLYINGYQYICNGELDEQVFFRFKYQNRRIYTLTWSGRFKRSDIVNIEGLEISE